MVFGSVWDSSYVPKPIGEYNAFTCVDCTRFVGLLELWQRSHWSEYFFRCDDGRDEQAMRAFHRFQIEFITRSPSNKVRRTYRQTDKSMYVRTAFTKALQAAAQMIEDSDGAITIAIFSLMRKGFPFEKRGSGFVFNQCVFVERCIRIPDELENI